jgi:glutamate dehydrogenase
MYPQLGVTRGEIITAFCSMMHPIMAKENNIAYSKASILETMTKERFIPFSASVADLFLARFNPKTKLSNSEFEKQCAELEQSIKADVEEPVAATLLLKMIDIVKHTLKTNVYMTDRYALGLRLDPRIMLGSGEDEEDTVLPYGIVFVHGRRFNGYHVRFRDISRGGLRLVTPRSQELMALESARHYDECYGLAFAQQLKNKDIPEGGSKAVCLIDTMGISDESKNFVMRKSVKAFVDSVLDLIVQTEETKEHIVDLFGKKEVLYLGPDEQVIPEDIDWVIQRAAYRGYETPGAFMSSKPRAGINHKVYGVTSEGVNVYLDVALRCEDHRRPRWRRRR